MDQPQSNHSNRGRGRGGAGRMSRGPREAQGSPMSGGGRGGRGDHHGSIAETHTWSHGPKLLLFPSPKVKDPRRNEDGTLKLGVKMANIYVGQQVEPFPIHHDLIVASSDYFAKALNGEFKEKDGIVRLEDWDPIAFTSYVTWLYSASVVVPGEKWESLLHQYILGNYIQDRDYKNAITDDLISRVTDKKEFPGGFAKLAWGNLPESSPFLTLLVDFWVNGNCLHWYQKEEGIWAVGDASEGPMDLWRRVAMGLVQQSKNPSSRKNWPSIRDRCQYHEHQDGEPKCV